MYQLSEIIPCPSSLFHIISKAFLPHRNLNPVFAKQMSFISFLIIWWSSFWVHFGLNVFLYFLPCFLKETINWSSSVTHSETVFLRRVFPPASLFFPCTSCPSLFEPKYANLKYSSPAENCHNLFVARGEHFCQQDYFPVAGVSSNPPSVRSVFALRCGPGCSSLVLLPGIIHKSLSWTLLPSSSCRSFSFPPN